MVLSESDAKEFEENQRHSFNVFLSNHLPLSRDIPDVRSVGVTVINMQFIEKNICRDAYCKQNRDGLVSFPKASVIICFHNEAVSVLLRTLTSIVNRSPEHLLQEIILVDDASDLLEPSLRDRLVKISTKIKLKLLHKREGLIRARTIGSRVATAPVLVFMGT